MLLFSSNQIQMPAHESRFHSSKADKKVKLPLFYSVASILKLAKNRWNLEYNLFSCSVFPNFRNFANLDGTKPNPFYLFSRANGRTLLFNSTMIIVVVLRSVGLQRFQLGIAHLPPRTLRISEPKSQLLKQTF